MQPYIIKNFLDVNICNKVISFIEENDKQDNEMVKRRLLRFGIDVMNGNTDSLNSLKDFGQEIRTFANKAGMLAKILHNNNKEIFLSTLWLSKQLPGSSIIRHMDTDSGKGSHYIYSGVIYLNDQIFGGEIVFPKINFTYKPEAGDLVLFDCRDKDSQHGVNKTETMRYAIPVWFTDDPKFAMA